MVDTLDAAYAVVQPGLEDVLVDELAELGVTARAESGGALFRCAAADLHRVHLHARTPTRVWIRLGRFGATSLERLAHGVVGLGWSRFCWPRQEVEVRVTTHRSRLRHRDRIQRKVQHSVRDALRRSPPRQRRSGRPPGPCGVLVRIEDDVVEVSVDASGEALYRRGWRTDIGAAPLRENLAACVLRSVGWRPGVPLVDPMCGSGTLCIEAASMAAGHPAGARRRFAFEQWPGHDAAAFARLKRSSAPRRGSAPIVGGDRNPAVLEAARSNARRAGVARAITFVHCDVGELQGPDGPGWVITNPPWGDRLKGAEPAWAALGSALRRSFAGWRVAVLAPRPALGRRLGIPLSAGARFPAGSLRVSVYTGVVPS